MDKKIHHSLRIIKQAVQKYRRIAVASSFGKDSMVVLHLVRQINPNIQVFAIMTPFKPKETFEFMRKVKKQWNLNLTVFQSKRNVSPTLHKTNPDECCYILKVRPTMEAVKDLDAWICGLRSTEGRTRVNYQEVEMRGGLAKINPILPWTEDEIWCYTENHNIPVHPWYDLGYRSLGCACCSKPNTEEERGGRWAGTGKVGGECGIHTIILKGKDKGECIIRGIAVEKT